MTTRTPTNARQAPAQRKRLTLSPRKATAIAIVTNGREKPTALTVASGNRVMAMKLLVSAMALQQMRKMLRQGYWMRAISPRCRQMSGRMNIRPIIALMKTSWKAG